MYDFLLTVHVLTVILWVGGGVTLHILIRRALKLTDRQQLHERFIEYEWLGNRFYPIFSLILIISGVFLVDEAGFEFDETFITLGFVGWTISFLIGIGFYGREGKKREAIAQAEGVDSASVLASANRTAMVNSFELLILLLVVVDMTTKPGFP
jgi:uncharacterized membrane protein